MITSHRLLVRGFLVFQQIARGARAAWVDGIFIFVNVLDDSVSVNDEGGSVGDRELGIQNAVIRGNFSREIAQQWKLDADLLGIGFVGELTVHADAQHLGTLGFKFGNISLICRELFRSTTGESQNIERQHYVLLSKKIAQLYFLSVLVGQREVRRFIPDVERRGLARQRRSQSQRQYGCRQSFFMVHCDTS